MQTICTSLQTDNHTNTSSLSFYRPDALPDAQPTVSKHWRQPNKHTRKILQNDYTQKCKNSLHVQLLPCSQTRPSTSGVAVDTVKAVTAIFRTNTAPNATGGWISMGLMRELTAICKILSGLHITTEGRGGKTKDCQSNQLSITCLCESIVKQTILSTKQKVAMSADTANHSNNLVHQHRLNICCNLQMNTVYTDCLKLSPNSQMPCPVRHLQ